MNRSEHVQWSKDRAIELLDEGDITQAFTSMMSDLGKHDETAGHPAIILGMQLNMGGMLSTDREMRKFIEGFN
jgi:hypothetical protein